MADNLYTTLDVLDNNHDDNNNNDDSVRARLLRLKEMVRKYDEGELLRAHLIDQLTPSKTIYHEMVYEDIDFSIEFTGKRATMSTPRMPCRCKLDKYCDKCG